MSQLGTQSGFSTAYRDNAPKAFAAAYRVLG